MGLIRDFGLNPMNSGKPLMDCEFGRVRRFGAWISSVSKSGVSVGRETEAKRRLLKKWERQ